MARKDHVLFYLDDEQRFRLSCDDLQWILERGNPGSRRPGRDSGYRGISFVCTTKAILRDVIREKRVPLSPGGKLLIDCLPDHFDEFRDMVRARGIDESRRWLYSRARKPIHDRSDLAQPAAGSATVWSDLTSGLPTSANDDRRPALRERQTP